MPLHQELVGTPVMEERRPVHRSAHLLMSSHEAQGRRPATPPPSWPWPAEPKSVRRSKGGPVALRLRGIQRPEAHADVTTESALQNEWGSTKLRRRSDRWKGTSSVF